MCIPSLLLVLELLLLLRFLHDLYLQCCRVKKTCNSQYARPVLLGKVAVEHFWDPLWHIPSHSTFINTISNLFTSTLTIISSITAITIITEIACYSTIFISNVAGSHLQ